MKMKKGKNKKIVKLMQVTCAASLFTLFSGCIPDNRCDTPFGEGATLDLSMPEFSALNHPGGALAINRGYKGIFVTRISYSSFVAFECACPNDHETRILPDADWGNSILTCPTCGSRFNALDGTPLTGSVTPCPLFEYNTTLDGNMLYIY